MPDTTQNNGKHAILEELREGLKRAARDQATGLIEEQFEDAFDLYRSSLSRWLNENPDGKLSSFNWKISLGVVLSPVDGVSHAVCTQINFKGRPHKAVSEPQVVSMQQNLDL